MPDNSRLRCKYNMIMGLLRPILGKTAKYFLSFRMGISKVTAFPVIVLSKHHLHEMVFTISFFMSYILKFYQKQSKIEEPVYIFFS